MYEFRAFKHAGRVYETRKEYLEDRARIGDNEDVPASVQPMLCNSIARANESFEDKDPAPGVVPHHFPWLTVVLGSGCATETTDPAGLTPFAPSQVGEILRSRSPLCDEVLPSDLARQFAERMIDDRLHHIRNAMPNATVSTETHDLDNSKRIALLVLSAALATSFYREAAAALQLPLDRRGTDCVSLRAPVTPSRLAELITKFEQPLLEVIQDLVPLLDAHNSLVSAESHILARITRILVNERKINRLDIQILTEFCWLALTEQCSIYHGWSELLALLARLDPSRLDPPVRYPLQPNPSRATAIAAIQSRYKSVSENSWQSRQRAVKSVRRDFFDSVANALCAQAALRGQIATLSEQSPDGAVLPPVASAFSTSFDLELEMALAARTDIPGFVIVLPAYFLSTKHKTASLHWLGAVIRKPKGLHSILEPEPSSWVMLSRMTWNDDWEYANWPFVVRLAGCPLVTLPGIALAPKSPPTGSVDPSLKLKLGEIDEIQSAILLDEYSAIQQHSTEMFGMATSQSSGLPEALTIASQD